ncbi:hypothetical protein J8I87_28375 [Paraburkholderia sp. LEh10]|jgi:hypothetical protein|uniref:hypothetical protein n=1 Tax=Paraburkholderia sp. LEh10 TaxID=2821353 RepID=UPI001AE4BB7B|nr:hypothetical protein [Paraburkholderia sp. LEh10]MBP0593540.1 hypothetical protein [Paraburkholderia sp. LEh10]
MDTDPFIRRAVQQAADNRLVLHALQAASNVTGSRSSSSVASRAGVLALTPSCRDISATGAAFLAHATPHDI